MKSKLLPLLSLGLVLLTGCATATFTSGRDFDAARVTQIEKGKTTASELVGWFGVPYSKTINADGSEAWQWLYAQGTSKAQSYVFSMDVKTETTGKQLIATIRGGVLETYSFTNGPLGGSVGTAAIGR